MGMTLSAVCATSAYFSQSLYTGKERDLESGLDYFGARYFSSNMGRFLSPDWSKNPQGVPYANYADPQSLNLYAFVGNNPTTQSDADGHATQCQHCDQTSFMYQYMLFINSIRSKGMAQQSKDTSSSQGKSKNDGSNGQTASSTSGSVGQYLSGVESAAKMLGQFLAIITLTPPKGRRMMEVRDE